ncbi:uncharacterized protein zbbx isoform X2 [Thunnus maccoyii]|uniref:uncharacterized protein zbbx isoform X2 n=1 Tax=Thunnus maccoyii TaxID=8240 RepID=UPI001C4D042A|nr:uncharacterized protein zbbx isoform X2 [Thunnus maccoyii]
MNLNDFVVLPNNKAKSVKLNARNLQELQMKTVTLAQESKEMEEKLQQLKESMSKEKEERGHSGGFRWKSGQCGSLNSSSLTNSTKKNKENTLQKLSAGKVKIRLLKDEPLTVPPQPPPLPPTNGHRTTRKNRLKGTICGQCEVRSAGLMCAECTESYCVGCFAKFHQKGALKLHRMIPIQTDIQTHVSTRDVVSCFQKQMNPSSYPSTFTIQKPSPNSEPNHNHPFLCNTTTRQGDQKPETGTEAIAKHTQLHSDPSQVLVVNHGEEKEVEMTKDGQKKEDEKGFSTSLLGGEYDEEDSARSFQEALRQWRGERSNGEGEPMIQEAMWKPVRPVSVSAMATQADLSPDRGPEGQERVGGEGRVPVRVEFMENSLTYMDRLLLKKHRRTPIEIDHPSLVFGRDLKSLSSNTNTEEETASSLTAQEEDFHRYCASLFAVPVSSSRTEPQITTTESCLIIEVLDETDRDTNGVFVAEQRTDNNIKVPSVQQVSSKGRELVPQTLLTGGGFSRVSLSPPSRTQPSRQSRASTQSKAPQKLHPSKPQASPAEHSMKLPSSKSKPSAYPTAGTPRISKTSIKTSTKSQNPSCSPTVYKSKPDHGSPQILSSPSSLHSQTEILKSSYSSLSFPPDVSPLASAISPTPEEHLRPSPFTSLSLRSTFTVSPSSSTELILLPKVYKSTPLQKGSPSPLLPEQSQSSQLFSETISSLKLSQSPPSNLKSPKQSQHSLCDPESLLSDNQLQSPLSAVSSTPHPPPKLLEPSLPQTNPVPYRAPEKTPSTLSPLKQSPLDVYSSYRSIPTYKEAPSFMSPTPLTCDHESSPSCQYTQCPSHLLNAIHSPSADKMKEEEELSIDSGDELSSDSLGLAPHEEDSSDDEPKMHGCLARGSSRQEDQGNSAISHLEDPFVPADAERENELQTDEPEQLSEPSMVMHRHRARSGSEQSCDLEEFSPLGLDMNCGHSDTPKHTHCGPRQASSHDADQTGSLGYRPSSSLSTNMEEHLLFRMMKDNHTQQTGFQIHSTTPSGRGKFTANELGTSGSWSNLSVGLRVGSSVSSVVPGSSGDYGDL